MNPKRTLELLIVSLIGASVVHGGATYGIYRSMDNGRSWNQVGQGLPPDLRVDALGRSGRLCLAGTERGIYVSTDDGASWTRPQKGIPESVKVTEFANLGNTTFASTTRGVWGSSDQGQSWKEVGTELKAVRVLSLGVVKGRLFAGTDLQGVYLLREDETGWEDVSTGLPDRVQIFQFAVQDDTAFVALYSRGVFRYDASGKKWTEVGKESPLRLVSSEGVLFAGRNPGGVYVSGNNGTTWTTASLGLPENAPTWSLAQHNGVVLIGTTGHSGLMRTENAGALWLPSDRGLPPESAAITFGVSEDYLLTAVISGK